jgi:hypothetical protein
METKGFKTFEFTSDDPSLADDLNKIVAEGVALYLTRSFQKNGQNLGYASKLKNTLTESLDPVFGNLISSNKSVYEGSGGREISLREELQQLVPVVGVGKHVKALIEIITELDKKYNDKEESGYGPVLDMTIPWYSVQVVQVGQGKGEKLG